MIGIAHYYLLTGDMDKAKNKFMEVFLNANQDKNDVLHVAASIGLALSIERIGNLTEAAQYYKEAVDQMEEQREILPANERRQFFAGKIEGFRHQEAYEELVRVLYKMGNYDESFLWSEHTKARALIDAIARKNYDVQKVISEQLYRKEHDLISNMASVNEQLDKAFQNENKELYTKLEQKLKQLRQEHQEFITQLRKVDPEYASIQYPQPLKANELSLLPDEVLIEYEVTQSETVVFLVSNGQITYSYSINITRDELQQRVGCIRKCMTTIAFSDG
jgi:tetratricopeptide (TPR) repeat protein